jgi:hypothetical protein
MFARVTAWFHAVGAARKHVVNWPELVLKAVSSSDDVFRSRAGGTLSCNGKALLRQLARLEGVWRFYGDALGVIRFEKTSLVRPNYFGREFSSVNGEVALDIGAYLGDTPLM